MGVMNKTTITNLTDQSFPFSRELFEDPHVVYHGTWSTYSQIIEAKGFGGALPFEHNNLEAIAEAWENVGILGSYTRTVFSNKPGQPRAELSMTGSFWHARAYATDGGGEVVRMVLKEARDFENLCSKDEQRLALKGRWEEGLKKSPGYTPTVRAVEFLGDQSALQATCRRVTKARQAIERVVHGGFPVVYGISVERHWFGETWDRYLAHWEEGDRATVELRCNRDLVSKDRIIGKAIYPNGTDQHFLGDLISRWTEVEALSRG
jgi:hypothetical protein